MVAPILNVTERFEPIEVVIIIEWITENRVSYNFSVFPEVVTTFIGESTIQLIIPYNSQLTVNVSATLCGQERTAIEIIYHGEPQYQVAIAFNNVSCNVMISFFPNISSIKVYDSPSIHMQIPTDDSSSS